ncbi:MAG: PilN domain-containing protein [Motiliproteus sp.]|nr:PilN domain-containing protein [Motiliproteus sp.]MCW9052274.1 PilN domain-containing protein [Motiliproteus sp.]
MARTLINLRPWRDDRRKERQQRFVVTSVMVALLAGAVVFGTGFYIETQTKRQIARNDYMRQEMAQLDTKIREIKQLKEKRARLLERLEAIQELQGNRPIIVRVFDELVRVLPEDLYYSTLSRSGEVLTVRGRASANKDVSRLMRSLDRSPWFSEPNLSNVGRGDGFKSFDMRVGLSKPKPEEGS